MRNWIRILFLIMLCSCVSEPIKEGEVNRSFGEDLALLQEYTDVVVLKDSAGDVQVAVVPYVLAMYPYAMSPSSEVTGRMSLR